MRKMIFYLIFLLFGFQSFSQVPPGSGRSKEDYLQKSKNQKKAAWILLTAGTVMAVGGGIGFNKYWDLSSNNTKAAVYGSVMMAGIAADLISIPLFISSGRNARRGARMSVNSQLFDLPVGNNTYRKPHPALSVTIPF